MAIRGQLSGCYLLSKEEYRDLSARVMVAEGPLREAQAEALHWRAEHDRFCRELDEANVRADKAEAENAALREGQPLYFCVGLVPHGAVPRVVSVRVQYLGTDAAQGDADPTPAPRPTANDRATKLDPARRVPLHAVPLDERRE